MIGCLSGKLQNAKTFLKVQGFCLLGQPKGGDNQAYLEQRLGLHVLPDSASTLLNPAKHGLLQFCHCASKLSQSNLPFPFASDQHIKPLRSHVL